MTRTKAIFLDRDGVILDNSSWFAGCTHVALLPGVPEGLRALKSAGYLLVVVTNQSPVGVGHMDRSDLERMHREMMTLLEAQGATVDAIYYCTHSPVEGCNCRKPATGMIDKAVTDLGIEAVDSWVIGDMRSDIALANNANMKAILIRSCATDIDEAEAKRFMAGQTARDLRDAVHIIESGERDIHRRRDR